MMIIRLKCNKFILGLKATYMHSGKYCILFPFKVVYYLLTPPVLSKSLLKYSRAEKMNEEANSKQH